MVILILISILGISPAFGFFDLDNWQKITSGGGFRHDELEELGQPPIYLNVNAGSSDLDGCFRSGVQYAEGATVPTDELCQDCLCKAGEVSCTMQKCRSARYNCKPVGFVKGTCCPLKFECDDEINELVQEIPFSNSDVKTFRNTPSAKSCSSNGKKYFSGQAMPVFSPCQLSCACVDGTPACTQEACPTPPPTFLGCSKLEESNECCPTYSCPSIPNTKQTSSCVYKGERFEERDYVPSSDKCLDCYCKDGEVVCASQKCPDPPAPNCRPLTSTHETCCPQKYECLAMDYPKDIDMESDTTTAVFDPTEPTPEVTTPEPISEPEPTPEVTTSVPIMGMTEPEPTPEVTTPEPISEPEPTTEVTTPEPMLTTVSLENEPIETITSSSISTEQTTLGSSTDDYTTESSTDAFTTDFTTDYTTVEHTTLVGSSTDDYTEDVPSTTVFTTDYTTDYTTVTEDVMVTETTTVVFDEMCSNDGIVYSDGENIPLTSQCQESCHCRNGTVACIEKACSPAPPAFLRCASMEVIDDSDECCPKYDCPSIPPSPDTDVCERDGIQYYDGEFVPSPDLCTDCYCLYGEILCAFLECYPPVRDSCAPIYDDERACCPQHYECDIDSDIQTTTMNQTSEEPEASTDIPLFRFAL